VTVAGECWVGVDLGGTKLFGALVDREGGLSHETYFEHATGTEGIAERLDPPLREDESRAGLPYAALVDMIGRLLETALGEGRVVRGVGVGAPGTCRADGVVILAAALDWRDLPLGDLLARRFGVPCAVENDVNLWALGEHAFGAARGTRSAFVLAVGTGVGGAVIVDGRLWRGHRFAAGEAGSLLTGREMLGWDGREWGGLERAASGTGIAVLARERAAAHGQGLSEDALRPDRVFAAAEAGEAWARETVEETLDHWAVALAAVQAVLDPEVIVLGGGVLRDAGKVIPRLTERLRGSVPVVPRLVASELGARAAVLGAPALLAVDTSFGSKL
jgi:predicted NBD/HSP70 family sugar kinase